MPEAHDQIGPYRLVRELGHGSFARVFLAEQEDLGDRLVVLKVTRRRTPEPYLLGRARHSHIVEVLRHETAESGALNLLSMPFLGGASLDAVLEALVRSGAAGRRRPRSGRELLAALDRVSAPEHPGPGLARPARQVIAPLSFARAIAWIGARLAEALDHADQRRVSHGDVKPANILLTIDGTPMLLDFNLAADRRRDEAMPLAGTPAYMSPEQHRALYGPWSPPNSPAFDSHRADLYSLGLVLREALTGQRPAPFEERMIWTVAERRAVPAALRAILGCCLDPVVTKRYARGSEFAADLDRWVRRRRLLHAREPLLATFGRWTYQHRRAMFTGAIILTAGVSAHRAVDRALRDNEGEQARAKWGAILDGEEPGVFQFYQPGRRWDDSGDAATTAWRHLAAYRVMEPEDWRRRTDVQSLPTRDREELEVWLSEQAWRVAHAALLLPEGTKGERPALLAVSQVGGPSPPAPLAAQYLALHRRLGLPGPKLVPPPPGRDWLARYLQALEAEPGRKSLDLYREILAEYPDSFWAEYRASAVAYNLGDYQAAAVHLDRCIARRPRNAALRTMVAGCYTMLGRLDDALDQCERAAALDPLLAEVHRNSAFVHAKLGRRGDVETALLRYATLTGDRGRLPSLLLRFDLSVSGSASVFRPSESNDAARRVLSKDSEQAGVRAQLAYQLHQDGRTGEAIAELRRAVEDQPGHLPARFLLADLLRASGSEDEASQICKLLIDDPFFEDFLARNPRVIRAYLMAAHGSLRSGRPDLARAYAQRGHDRTAGSDPGLRARFLSVQLSASHATTGADLDDRD